MQQAGLFSFPPPSAVGNLTSRSPTLLYRLTAPPPANYPLYLFSQHIPSSHEPLFFFYSRISAHRWTTPSSRRFGHGGSALTAYVLGLNYRVPVLLYYIYLYSRPPILVPPPPPQSALTLRPSPHISLFSEGESPQQIPTVAKHHQLPFTSHYHHSG